MPKHGSEGGASGFTHVHDVGFAGICHRFVAEFATSTMCLAMVCGKSI